MKDINTLWDLYISKEEYVPMIKDRYNRTPYYLSVNKNVFEPVVSKYLFANGFSPEYPDGKKFAVCLSHDIDFLFDNLPFKRFLIYETKSLLKLRIKHSLDSLKLRIKNEIHPSLHTKRILECEKKFDAKSSFYFLSVARTESDFNYELNDIGDTFAEIRQNNCEIGLHGSQYAYNNLDKLLEEKERLEKNLGCSIYGYRSHILKFQTPQTWELLKSANFIYDTTFGYADCVGFRNGMCYPYKPYNDVNKQFIDIIELPLNIMDVSLFNYMKLNYEEALKLCKVIINNVKSCNGVLTLLWHNNNLTDEMGLFYSSLLKYLADKNAWLTSSANLIDWWTENKYPQTLQDILQDLQVKTMNEH